MNALCRVVLLLVCSISALAHATGWNGAPEALPRHEKAVLNPAALTGLWYSPSQNGHGFALTFTGDGRVAATWYVYQGTRQVWLIGAGNLANNQAALPTFITSGANFPPGFDPNAVQLTSWGTLTLDVQACDRINVSWTSTIPGYGSGSVVVQPLIVAGALPCVVTTNDDRADGCPNATAVAPNGEYSARIDPETDVDFYRLDLTQRGVLLARSRSSLDMLGTIYDADCNALTQNDDNGEVTTAFPNQYDFSTSAVLAPGTYYVSARTYGFDATGPYSLVLSYDTNIPADDFGDTCRGAPPLAVGSSVNGRIDPALDTDYFRVDLTGQTALLAQITDLREGLDTKVEIRDAKCQVLADNDDFDSQASEVSLVLGAGTYFVSVHSYNAASTGGYTLKLSVAANNDDVGDFCTVATPIAIGATVTQQILPALDADYFAVDLPAPGTFTMQTSNISTLDPRVTLYDSTCSPLNESDDNGPDRNSYLTYATQPAGRFYVRVRAADGVSVGGYSLTTRFVASNEDVDEHGNSCATATPIAQDGSAGGFINTPGDADFFRVDKNDATRVFMQSRVYANLNAAIAILDSSCAVLGENAGPDTDGNGLQVIVNAPPPGPYYIRIRSADGSVGPYAFNYGQTDVNTVATKSARTAPKPLGVIGASAPRGATQFRSAQATPRPAPPRVRGTKAITNPSSLSGLWYDPAQNGQGVQITFDASGTVALTWYVYQGTRQVWLIGSAALTGNRVTLPMFISSGGDFLPAFDPNSVTLTPWGSVTLDVQSCTAIAMSWAPTIAGYGAGSMNLSPLIVSGGLTCAVSSAVDDHGNDCAHADAAVMNGTVAGRIDPTNDQDFFRISVGSAGTLTVQSSGSSTLNPSGTLLDANCAAIAANDDSAGREFSIVRTVTPGTYYVGVAASGGTTIGDYVLGTSFAPTGGTTSNAVQLSLTNALVYDVDFRINGGAPIRVGAGAALTQSLTLAGTLSVSFALAEATNAQGAPVGDLLGGAFDPVTNPSGNLSFVVDNEVGAQRYFAPVIANKTSNSRLIGVNMGTSAENRCNCVVPGGSLGTRVGYYLFLPNSNVRAYAAGSGYSGTYGYWGSDSGGQQLLNVPLVNLLETPSGRVSLKYVSF